MERAPVDFREGKEPADAEGYHTQYSRDPELKNLKKYEVNQVKSRRQFKTPAGGTRGKVSMWSAAAYSFALTSRPPKINLSFSGQTAKTKSGSNSFELGLAFVDSKRRNPPQITWLRTSANRARHSVSFPDGNYDEMLLLVVNRGPRRHREEDGRLPKVDFEFAITSSLPGSVRSMLETGNELAGGAVAADMEAQILRSVKTPAAAESVLAEITSFEKERGGQLSPQMKLLKGKIESAARFQRLHEQPLISDQ